MKAERKTISEGSRNKHLASRRGVRPAKRKVAVAQTRTDAQGKITGRGSIQRDITARKQAEEALHKSEERLKYALEGTNDGLWDWNVQAGTTYFSPRWKTIIGYTDDELPNNYEAWDARLHPDDKPRVLQALQAHFDDAARNYEPEFRMLAKTGEWIWIQARGRVVERDREGRPLRMVGTHTDITERKQADEALRRSQEEYKILLNTIDGIVWEADANTFEFQFVSQQAERLLGYPIERWMNEPTFWKDHIHPDDQSWAVNYCIVCTRDKISHQFDYRMIAADGRVVWLRDIVAVFVENDQAVKLRGIMVDITAQKQAEEKLRISEERLNLALTAANDGLWDWNVQTGAVYFSPRWKAMIGYAEDELPNTYEAWDSRLHADDRSRVLQALQAHFADTALHYEPEFRMRTKAGEWIWIQARGRLVEHDHEGRPLRMIGMHSDITERKRAEEERRQLAARMQQAQKLESLGVLAGGIAHDFNNLLTSMLGYASLALMELPTESVACPMLREIEQAARRAADLTQQLLAYSGRGKFVIQVLQLDTLVREMTKLLETVISKKAALHLDLAPAAIEADATQIRQIVMNLITNASDALEGQSGVIRVRTGVRYADAALLHSPYLQEELPAGDYAYVEVEDNGCGMTEETLARIFDPFFTTKFTGRGLGLAAVLGIAKGHQGTIKIASAPGRGTVFQALFPCARAAAGEASVAGSAGVAQRGHGTVLVVEDEESIRSFTRRVLERAGFQVLEAADGQAGLDLFGQYAPEIVAVLLDLTMPRMDGQEVLQQLRRLDPNIPVLVMSGYSDLEVSARFAGMGASGFIQKPFHPRDLSALVFRMVPSKAAIGGR